MKILQIIPTLSSGGAERLLIDLSNELIERKDIQQVTVLTFIIKNPKVDFFYLTELSPKVNHINLIYKTTFIGKIFSFIKMYKTIVSIKADIVHFHLVSSLFFSLLAVFFNRKPKYIQTLHNDAFVHKSKLLIPLFIQKYIYSNLVSIYSISNANEESFFKCYNMHTKGTILNGRNDLKLSEKSDEVKKEINILKRNQDTLVFLNIARCHEQKNHKMLIEAFNLFQSKGYNAILLIIGNGYDSELGRELLKIDSRNVFFLGEKNNIADYFNLCDAFCLSSIYEGMPVTLIESLSSGITPISTPTSGAVDICSKGIGFISNDFTSQSFFNAMVQFVEHKDEIDMKKIRYIFERDFSIQQCADKYMSVYKND